MYGSATTQLIADTLTREGSLWFESAFCKGVNGGALLFSDPVEVVVLSSLSGLKRFFQTLEPSVADRLPHTDHEQKSVKLLAVNSLQAVLPLFTLVPIARS